MKDSNRNSQKKVKDINQQMKKRKSSKKKKIPINCGVVLERSQSPTAPSAVSVRYHSWNVLNVYL